MVRRWLMLAVVSLSLGCGAEDVPPTRRPSAGRSVVLIDRIHANDRSDIGLRFDVHDYHALCGFRMAFDYLRSREVEVRLIDRGPVSARHLEDVTLLFLNLVSAEKEPFLVSEIEAIQRFVEDGGSLLIITDHSNCYFHAWRLKPLLTQLGIESPTDTACDVFPHTLGGGNGWIAVRRFDPHPITAGLRMIGIQTGGRVDARHAVAWTSEKSWADAWHVGPYGEDNAPGCFGNFWQDDGEASGPLGVVLARTLGRGRIVIVADQNIFSDPFLHYADNGRLWVNTMAWLLDDASLGDMRDYRSQREPLVCLFEAFDRPAFGNDDKSGFYHAMVLISRFYWAFADETVPEEAALVVMAHNRYDLSPLQAESLAAHLRRGKNLLVLGAEADVSTDDHGAMRPLLARLEAEMAEEAAFGDRVVISLISRRPGEQLGAIHLLTASPAPENRALPEPTLVPDVEGFQRNARVLSAVREALGTDAFD